jgi:DNA segregation ATPase FtsK/SpoIIIE, S-DNA-T family
MDAKLKAQLTKEIKAINGTLSAFGINAGTMPGWTAVGGDQLVIYTLKTGRGQSIADIEKRLPELSEAISSTRRQLTLVRLLRFPLRLEVTHPQRKPLAWDDAALQGDSHAMLLGRTYDGGARDLWLPFDNAPHVLVAGTTGAGKSVELANMLLGLCWNTSPADLRLVLIDMKNTDLVPFKRLPHVDVLATDTKPAFDALRNTGAILKQRQAQHTSHPRVLVVVDEYTDLVGDTEGMSHADRIARQGRSANINMLVATQHPTSAALGGSTIKNNFTNRVIGLVADANAASNAAGRPGTHAELLPGKGAFLWVSGPNVTRFQSYLLTDIDVESIITRIGRKWRNENHRTVLEPVLRKNHSVLVVEPHRTATEPVLEPLQDRSKPVEIEIAEPLFPLSEKRPLSRIEADDCRRLNSDGFSKSELCRLIYGSKNGQYMEWINAALAAGGAQNDGKIIKLKRTGT